MNANFKALKFKKFIEFRIQRILENQTGWYREKSCVVSSNQKKNTQKNSVMISGRPCGNDFLINYIV